MNNVYVRFVLAQSHSHELSGGKKSPFDFESNFPRFNFCTGLQKKNGPPCHTKFDLFSIVLGKSDERMPYRLGLDNSFAVVYIAVTSLVQELY